MEKNVWVLTDDRIGSNSQARGVAKVLGWPTIEKNLSYNFLAKLPNFLRGVSLIGVEKSAKKTLRPPFPDLVIAASRRSAIVALWVRKQSGGRTKVIQLGHPGDFGLEYFDRVFIPEHDRNKKMGPNVMKIIGCAHRVTPDFLAEAQEKWHNDFANLPKPLTAVIVGGSIKTIPFSLENAQELAKLVKKYKEENGGSILITTSRRTGVASQELIMKELKDIPAHTYLWGIDKGENPYPGYLACADDIIVTGDSVSMCCEACGTGKKIMVFTGRNWLTPKHHRFINSLFEKEMAFPLEQEYKHKGGFKTYNPANKVAEEIKKLF